MRGGNGRNANLKPNKRRTSRKHRASNKPTLFIYFFAPRRTATVLIHTQTPYRTHAETQQKMSDIGSSVGASFHDVGEKIRTAAAAIALIDEKPWNIKKQCAVSIIPLPCTVEICKITKK